jgi:pilus assembly protein CpaF
MEGDLVTTQDIFVFERSGMSQDGRVLGKFRPTGVRPKFSEKLKTAGFELPPHLFQTAVEVR